MLLDKLIISNMNFVVKRNTIVSILMMIINTIYIIKFYQNKHVIYISICLLFLYIYLLNTSIAKKISLIVVYIVFSAITLIGEHFVILYTKGSALKYSNTIPGMNVPAWLFVAYLNMVILIELLNNYTIEINKVISNIG